ncbi:MAG: hypothetical protein R3F43_14740 [bacterium]
MLDDLANGIPFMGIEGFRPAFFDSLDGLFAHLPTDATWLVLDPMATAERLAAEWDRLAGATRGRRPRSCPPCRPAATSSPPPRCSAP